MLLHAFPAMSVSSFCEFPENYVYRHGGFTCFRKYLHRKLLTTNFSLIILKMLKNVHLLDLFIETIIFLFYSYLIPAKMTKHFGTNLLFPLLRFMINIS